MRQGTKPVWLHLSRSTQNTGCTNSSSHSRKMRPRKQREPMGRRKKKNRKKKAVTRDHVISETALCICEHYGEEHDHLGRCHAYVSDVEMCPCDEFMDAEDVADIEGAVDPND